MIGCAVAGMAGAVVCESTTRFAPGNPPGNQWAPQRFLFSRELDGTRKAGVMASSAHIPTTRDPKRF